MGTSCSLEEIVTAFRNHLTNTLNKVAPLKTKKKACIKTSSWIDSTSRELKRQQKEM